MLAAAERADEAIAAGPSVRRRAAGRLRASRQGPAVPGGCRLEGWRQVEGAWAISRDGGNFRPYTDVASGGPTASPPPLGTAWSLRPCGARAAHPRPEWPGPSHLQGWPSQRARCGWRGATMGHRVSRMRGCPSIRRAWHRLPGFDVLSRLALRCVESTAGFLPNLCGLLSFYILRSQ